MAGVEAGGKPFVIGNIGGDDALLVEITERSVKSRLFVSATETQVVVVDQGIVVQDGTLPVGALSEGFRVWERGDVVGSLRRFIAENSVPGGIQQVELVCGRLGAEISVVVDAQGAGFSFFGGNDDDAAGCFCPVNSR